MMENEYDKNKQHVNIGIIGHVDSGKLTLTAALTEIIKLSKKVISEENDVKENNFPEPHIDIIGYYDYGIILIKAHNMSKVLEYKLEDMTFQNTIGLVEVTDRLTTLKDIDEIFLNLNDNITDIKDNELFLINRGESKYLNNNNSYKNIYKKNCNYKNRKKYGYVFRRK